MNTQFIKEEVFDMIKSDVSSFKKSLYNHYDFIGNEITHIGINIYMQSDYLITIKLIKGIKSYNWIVINNSGRNTALYVNEIEKLKNRLEPREVNLIKSKGIDSFHALVKIIERDNKIKKILE